MINQAKAIRDWIISISIWALLLMAVGSNFINGGGV